MLDGHALHREVLRVPGRETSPHRYGAGSYQTIALAERDAALCMVASPATCAPSLRAAERCEPKTGQEAPGRISLTLAAKAAMDLLDVHDGREEPLPGAGEILQPADGSRTSP